MIEEITSILGKKPGEYIVYHRGHLAADREPPDARHKENGHGAINETANIAWKLFESGQIVLVQRRNDKGSFDYLAVRK